MLNEHDKRMVGIVVREFTEWHETQANGEAEQSKYGLELLGVSAQDPVAGLWSGFYGGFGAGVKFMSVEQKDAE